MHMEYSPQAVVVAKSLQAYTYMYVSMATIWTYEYICLFHQEWTFLLQSRCTKVKGIYIITRYAPFFFFIMHLYMNFVTNESQHECNVWNAFTQFFSTITVAGSEFIFALRTYALWNNSRVVLMVMLASFFAVAAAVAGIIFTSPEPFQTSTIPGITGCYQHEGTELFIPFLLLFILELELLCLTVIPAIRKWRSFNGRLYLFLVKHNIFYYVCSLFFSALNVVTTLLLHYAYQVMFHKLQFIVLAILATRMHLHLWRSESVHGNRRAPDVSFVNVPLSEPHQGDGDGDGDLVPPAACLASNV